MKKKLAKWILVFLALLPIIYGLLGFFVVPFLVKQTVPKILDGKLTGTCEIGSVGMNPLNFSGWIQGLELHASSGEQIMRLERVSFDVDPVSFLTEKQIRLKEFVVNGAQIRVVVKEDGSVNVLEVLKSMDKDQGNLRKDEVVASDPESANSSAMPDFWVGLIQFSNIEISVEDLSRETPFVKKVSIMDVSARNVVSDPEEVNQFSLFLKSDREETIRLNSAIQFNPLTVESDVSIEQIYLSDYSSFVPETTGVAIKNGTLSFAGKLSVNLLENPMRIELKEGNLTVSEVASRASLSEDIRADMNGLIISPIHAVVAFNEGEPPDVEADFDLNMMGLDIGYEGQESMLFGFDKLSMNRLAFRMNQPGLSLESLEVVAPVVSLERSGDGQFRVMRLVSNKTDPAVVAETEELLDASKGISKEQYEENPSGADVARTDIRLGRFVLSAGELHFYDASVTPAAEFSIHPVDIKVSNLTLDPDQTADIEATLVVDQYGEVRLKSSLTIADLTRNTSIDCEIIDIPLKTFSPFAAPAIGYPIREGSFSGRIQGSITNNQLQSDNEIRVQKIRFGDANERVEGSSPPVKMAVALLEDSNGIIDLEVPISGALNDPNFSVFGVVRDVFGKILKNTATAPFRLATGITGGLLSKSLSIVGVDFEKEDPSIVNFESGKPDITKKSKESLKVVSEMLKKRPRLHLDITGSVDPNKDAAAQKSMLWESRLRDVAGKTREDKIKTLYDSLFPPVEVHADPAKELHANTRQTDENVGKPEQMKQPDFEDDGYYLASEAVEKEQAEGSFYLSGETRKAPMRAVQKIEQPIASSKKTDVENTTAKKKSKLSLEEMKAAILSRPEFQPADLAELAKKRADAVAQCLIDDFSVSPSRISVVKRVSQRGSDVFLSVSREP